MKLLTFTTLYPDSVRPRHGIFVETRLRRLVASGAVQSVVMAPLPWFPLRRGIFGKYATLARVPSEEQRHGIQVLHPRYPLIPRLGMSLAPFSLAMAAEAAARRLLAHGYDFDLIDAHYFYPDGVAAVMLARRLRKPVIVTARGSDINLITQYYAPRKLIQYAARRADGVIAVSEALKHRLLDIGVAEEKITVLRNGVDLELFHPVDRTEARRRFGLEGRVLLSVGNLVKLKGHDIAMAALSHLPEAVLLIVGDGAERRSLESLAVTLGVAQRVRFIPAMAQEILRDYYSAADVLVLASSHEGWPKVLLEATACGTPVVASRVGGAPEIVRSAEAGLLLPERTPTALAQAIRALFAAYPDRGATRCYAEQYGWDEITRGQLAVFEQVMAQCRRLGR